GHGVELAAEPESVTPAVGFDPGLRETLASSLAAQEIRAPVLPTGAGHDAGVLAARLPTAMLFVRNPTGVSHSPAEHAEAADCAPGVRALATVLEDLACRGPGTEPPLARRPPKTRPAAAGRRPGMGCGAGMPTWPGCPSEGSGRACSSRRLGS